jgi:hypothetical protein
MARPAITGQRALGRCADLVKTARAPPRPASPVRGVAGGSFFSLPGIIGASAGARTCLASMSGVAVFGNALLALLTLRVRRNMPWFPLRRAAMWYLFRHPFR